MLQCTKCEEWKDEAGFFRSRRNSLREYQYLCKSCALQYQRSRQRELRERGLCTVCAGKRDTEKLLCSSCRGKRNIAERSSYQKLKSEVYKRYGGAVCACCGEGRIEFLSIDHIDGSGSKHRKEMGITPGTAFYQWLKRNNYPSGYQVLCMNCNFAKGKSGYCPHTIERKVDWDAPLCGVAA